jgi:hypothetical protein
MKRPAKSRPATVENSPVPPPYPAHDRTAALADGLRKFHREGDMRDREYARQMQEITREAADE